MSFIGSLSLPAILVGLIILIETGRLVYNLWLHPLAKIPGPKIAATTTWWRTYQELCCSGPFMERVADLHKKYGDVVRLGPNEVHFANPDAFHEIYNINNKWDKEWAVYQCFSADRSAFGTIAHREAKERRDALWPVFNRRAVSDLQNLIVDKTKLDSLCRVLTINNETGKSSDLFFGLRCFAMDTITSFCYARSIDAVHAPDFKAPVILAMQATLPAVNVFKHFPLLRKAVFSMPRWLAKITSPDIRGLLELQELLEIQISRVLKDPALLDEEPHQTIYHALLNRNNEKPRPIPSRQRIYEETQSLLFAGGDTVTTALFYGMYHLLSNQSIVQKAKAELLTVWPDVNTTPRFEDLDKLPYLSGIVKECLRMSPIITAPMPRIVPAGGAMIQETYIPAGTTVGTAMSFVHYSPTIFPEPEKFSPERWMGPDAQKLEHWLVVFSRGPRTCVGINLALCEMYLAIATLLRKFDLVMDDPKPTDLVFDECFSPHFKQGRLQVSCKPVLA